ncbi:MAG: diadenylate cyclase CdaA [Patescibacteria group bacterium]|jgi:diadenylate cyclase
MFSSISAYFSTFTLIDYITTILDIGIVAVLIYFAFAFVKGTKATRIIYGIIILSVVVVIGRLLNLQTLNWVLSHLTLLILVAIPVVFQPELRRALERLGRANIFGKTKKESTKINDIIEAIEILKKNRIGALIVIQRKTGLLEYVESGTELNANLSIALLLNIFFPNSPLHDGAVIILGNKILAAGCMLPLTEGEYSMTYGTRHKAAIGVTENTDAIALVVSEERGEVSIAIDGHLEEKVGTEKLANKLEQLV